VAIVVLLVIRLDGEAVVDALRRTEGGSLAQGGAAGVAIVAMTTACGAWRWRLVAGRLRVELPLRMAVSACYRSQFLNAALPGGVLGDLDRGVRHGRVVEDVGVGLRAVAWERSAGQVVLAAVTLPALVLSGAAVPATLAVAAWVVLVAGALAWGAAKARRARPPGVSPAGRPRRMAGAVAADLRSLADPAALCGIVVASLVVVAGHVAVFVIAARIAGVGLPITRLAPLALLVLVGAMVPLNVAGWGPREGVAAWAFATAGQGAPQGVAAAVVFGGIVAVATLPGAVLLLAGRSAARSAARSGGRSGGRAGGRPASRAAPVGHG
jgi:hypothetical protein